MTSTCRSAALLVSSFAVLLVGAGSCRTRSEVQSSSTAPPVMSYVPQFGNRTRHDTEVTLGDSTFSPPESDLPANRLHERVDGAEPWLQSIGCNRLLAWRLPESALELEVLVFDSVAGAQQALDKDSGKSRTKGAPGDEGWTNSQVVYFRRGTQYCRLIAENREHAQALLSAAQRVDAAILRGTLIR